MNFKQLDILHPDKTHTFKSPLDPCLVRTGTLGGGDCYIHSFLYATSESYKNAPHPQRMLIARQVREKLADGLTLSDYKKLGDGELYRMNFVLHFRDVLSELNLDDFDHWDNKILSDISDRWKTTSIADCETIISEPLPVPLERIEDESFKIYQNHLRTQWIDAFGIEYISNVFKINVFVIKGDDRQLYRMAGVTKFDQSVILCWIHETHYEVIGRMNENHRVVRVFKNNDPLIQRLKRENYRIKKLEIITFIGLCQIYLTSQIAYLASHKLNLFCVLYLQLLYSEYILYIPVVLNDGRISSNRFLDDKTYAYHKLFIVDR